MAAINFEQLDVIKSMILSANTGDDREKVVALLDSVSDILKTLVENVADISINYDKNNDAKSAEYFEAIFQSILLAGKVARDINVARRKADEGETMVIDDESDETVKKIKNKGKAKEGSRKRKSDDENDQSEQAVKKTKKGAKKSETSVDSEDKPKREINQFPVLLKRELAELLDVDPETPIIMKEAIALVRTYIDERNLYGTSQEGKRIKTHYVIPEDDPLYAFFGEPEKEYAIKGFDHKIKAHAAVGLAQHLKSNNLVKKADDKKKKKPSGLSKKKTDSTKAILVENPVLNNGSSSSTSDDEIDLDSDLE
ncbi:hypothetical protein M427DRAFT_39847 [Gonapodya prolifera JEL478]|uniref:Uncharacterized protein n=1 Tax=Gonapodya prolifera (strain JEL478) TaxID=1344416 RepID=A0A138ZXM9_GONPJ|nr:hypothetical protein M427DRAFT_39847 [Gonapodya prolifera JEL478]|eukprot:KXS08893.1 hypothetical protein M427DRAFT_39847 [Gonapodya prolifera JEL478]